VLPNYYNLFIIGVSHGDDTMYVIKTQYGDPHDNVEDAKLIPVMVNIWSSFAKTGYVYYVYEVPIHNYFIIIIFLKVFALICLIVIQLIFDNFSFFF
jgi:hypothetical protein